MEIRPIFSSLLRHHRVPSILIMLEIALACAVLCNAMFMTFERLTDINLPNAIDESGISIINIQGADPTKVNDDIPRNLSALRELPGVKAVSVTNTVPVSRDGEYTAFSTKPGQDVNDKSNVITAEYLIAANGEKALGLQLTQGRFFNEDEYAAGKLVGSFMPQGHAIIITRSLAERMWHGQSVLGKVLYFGNQFSYTVVGVVENVLRPSRGGGGDDAIYYSSFLPIAPSDSSLQYYVVRSDPNDRQRIMRDGKEALARLSPGAVIDGQSFTDMRSEFFDDNRSLVWMLLLVCAVMVAVTAVGIVGLTNFWVGQRRKHIGVRRALGATRWHILHYFQTENFILSSAGVALGMGLAYGINMYLMQHYEMTRMPWLFLPGGAIALWVTGQLAVLGPALRASFVPPVSAIRST